MERWQPTDVARKYELRIKIQQDQLVAAKALLQHAYSAQLPPDASPSLLLQICSLADREEMVSAQQAACTAMAALDPMPEAILYLSFSEALPGLEGTDGWKQLQKNGAEALQQRYGDLEKVINTEEMLVSFQNLPFAAVLALLKHEGTCVGTEGAVCLAVGLWLQQAPSVQISKEQLRQLAEEIRFAGMPSRYRYHVLHSVNWLVRDALLPQELVRVLSYFQLTEQQQQATCWRDEASDQQIKAWVQRPPRPMSSYNPILELEVSMQQVQEAYSSARQRVATSYGYWGGLGLVLSLGSTRPTNQSQATEYTALLAITDDKRGVIECTGLAVGVECLTGPAGCRSLPINLASKGLAVAGAILADMTEWRPHLLQPYATANKLRFRAALQSVDW